jgi:hypothetical protein
MLPPAPPRFVDDEVVAEGLGERSPMCRAKMSVVPPAGNGTIILTMRLG